MKYCVKCKSKIEDADFPKHYEKCDGTKPEPKKPVEKNVDKKTLKKSEPVKAESKEKPAEKTVENDGEKK